MTHPLGTTEEERRIYYGEIHRWIIEGLFENEMMARLRDMCPAAKSTTRRKWIKEVRKRISEVYSRSNDFEVDLSLTKARFLDLYNRQLSAKQYDGAHKTLVDLCKIMGTYPHSRSVANITVNNDNRSIEDRSDKELLNMIEGTVVIPAKRLTDGRE